MVNSTNMDQDLKGRIKAQSGNLLSLCRKFNSNRILHGHEIIGQIVELDESYWLGDGVVYTTERGRPYVHITKIRENVILWDKFGKQIKDFHEATIDQLERHITRKIIEHPDTLSLSIEELITQQSNEEFSHFRFNLDNYQNSKYTDSLSEAQRHILERFYGNGRSFLGGYSDEFSKNIEDLKKRKISDVTFSLLTPSYVNQRTSGGDALVRVTLLELGKEHTLNIAYWDVEGNHKLVFKGD